MGSVWKSFLKGQKREMPMTGKDDRIPEDVLKAFEQAAKALYAWDSIGGDEPTVIVDGSPMPISMVATLAGTYRDLMPADLYWRMVHHAM
jgi:hypothetical protein